MKKSIIIVVLFLLILGGCSGTSPEKEAEFIITQTDIVPFSDHIRIWIMVKNVGNAAGWFVYCVVEQERDGNIIDSKSILYNNGDRIEPECGGYGYADFYNAEDGDNFTYKVYWDD